VINRIQSYTEQHQELAQELAQDKEVVTNEG
jgi:hypothetical protein